MIDNGLNRDQKYQAIKAAMRDVVTTLGLDLSDDSLQRHRTALRNVCGRSVFRTRLFQLPKISVIENKMAVDEMVKITDISSLAPVNIIS